MRRSNTFHSIIACMGLMLCSLLILSPFTARAQYKPVIGVKMTEVNGMSMNLSSLDNLVRLELEKMGKMEVIDKYDLNNTLQRNNINSDSCKSKTCLVAAGKLLKAERMLTGNVDRYGNKVIVVLRLIDVKNSVTEKTQVDEYLDMPARVQQMLSISISKLFDLEYDHKLEKDLKEIEELDNAINNPDIGILRLGGPRVGFSWVTGSIAERVQASEESGGFNAYPYMTVFGYQFESQYLSEGNFQALIEFIPAIAGADQNLFNPSFSILQGFRTNKQGWEFALGPNFSLAPMANGYYNSQGQWTRVTRAEDAPDNVEIISRIDRRGTYELRSAFVFAIGRSIRSGRLNIPLNAYVIPQREGWRIGFSMGFNVSKSAEYKQQGFR